MTEQPDTIMAQIGMLNLRINDMMTQLNTTLKALMEENRVLKQENAQLKQAACFDNKNSSMEDKKQ